MKKTAKKITALALTASLAFSMGASFIQASANAKETSEWKKAYDSYITENIKSEAPDTIKKFIDLDKDGTKECIYIEVYNRAAVRTFTLKDGEVTEAGEEIGGVNSIYYHNNKKKGTHTVVFQTSDSAFESGLLIMNYADGTYETLYNYDVVYEDEEHFTCTDLISNKKISEQKFNKLLDTISTKYKKIF